MMFFFIAFSVLFILYYIVVIVIIAQSTRCCTSCFRRSPPKNIESDENRNCSECCNSLENLEDQDMDTMLYMATLPLLYMDDILPPYSPPSSEIDSSLEENTLEGQNNNSYIIDIPNIPPPPYNETQENNLQNLPTSHSISLNITSEKDVTTIQY